MGLASLFRRSPRKKQCRRCGKQAVHGYSKAAESVSKDIQAMCLPCLIAQLVEDYSAFHGRAIVIAPAAGLPCYVFRGKEEIDQGWKPDVQTYLQAIGSCAQCGGTGSCLWIESRGLAPDNFDQVLERGPHTTLLSWGNPAPVSL